jgi:WD40 repeat protein
VSAHIRLVAVPALLLGTFACVAMLDGAAQPAKKPAVTIPPEPLGLRAGEPLSTRTLVQRPPAVTGAVSWTIETRRHRGYLAVSALSPDGKKLATGGLDGIIRVWDADTGEFLRALVGHNSYVYGLAWAPDGNTLASAGSFDGTARLWDTHTGMPLRVLKGHKGYTMHVAWSRDGKFVLVAGGESGFLTLWDVTKPEPVKTSETGKPITGVSWGVDPKLVAVSGTGMGVQVWDVREGKTPLVMVVPTQNGSAVAWSPDGKWIAGGSATKTTVWDAENGKEKHVLDAPAAAVAFNPTSDALAVSTGTGVKVWTAFDKEPKTVALSDARALAWAPDGSGLFGTAAVAVRWQPLDGKQPARTIDAAADFPVQLTPGRPLVTGLGTVAPQLWDVSTGKLVATLEGHTGGVTAVAWSKDGKTLATASADKTGRLWDSTGKPVRTLSGHDAAVSCVAWADSKTLATGSSDKTVRVWHTGSDIGKIARTHKGAVTAVAWSKDGKLIASGDTQHTVIVGAPDADKDKAQSITASAAVQSLAWAGNGKSLAVGIETGNVEVFAPAGGKAGQTYERNGSPPAVSALAWSPDGNALLAGRGNHTAQVWPANGTKVLFDLQCMAPVTHVGWSPAGNSMVISESDRAVRVFDLANGQLRSSVVADGKQVAVISAAGHYRVADEATCELVYVVQTAKGQETLTPKDFVAKYKFRNNPAAVVLMDR